MNPAINRHLQLEIKTLQNARLETGQGIWLAEAFLKIQNDIRKKIMHLVAIAWLYYQMN
jgi:hypothetical protein